MLARDPDQDTHLGPFCVYPWRRAAASGRGVNMWAVPGFSFSSLPTFIPHVHSPHPHSWQEAYKLTEDRLWVQTVTNTPDWLITFYLACLSEVVTRFETSPITSYDSGLHRLFFSILGLCAHKCLCGILKRVLHSGNSKWHWYWESSFCVRKRFSPCTTCENNLICVDTLLI